MFKDFSNAAMAHVSGTPQNGDAFERVISRGDFAAAYQEISGWQDYAPTPLHHLRALAEALGLGDILYKDEGPRFGLGSFKALGGAYAAVRLVARQDAGITLATATDGNHGRSLAWGAKRLGCPCQIYIHRDVSEGRAAAMRDLGAAVTRIDGDYDASVAAVRRDAKAQGWYVVSDTSWPGYSQPPTDVMAGYGVMVREIVDALDVPPTHVFLQAGVGGLAAAIAAGFRQHWGADAPRVVVVEPDLAPCLFASAQAGALTNVTLTDETLMAGLSCGEPSPLAWEVLREQASDFVTIPEAMFAPAMRLAARPMGDDPALQAGESAVAGFAAMIAAAQGDLRTTLGLTDASRVLIIGSEGITDPHIYAGLVG